MDIKFVTKLIEKHISHCIKWRSRKLEEQDYGYFIFKFT